MAWLLPEEIERIFSVWLQSCVITCEHLCTESVSMCTFSWQFITHFVINKANFLQLFHSISAIGWQKINLVRIKSVRFVGSDWQLQWKQMVGGV